MTQGLSKRVVLLLFFICLNSSHAASQVRDYTLGADLDKYVCYSKLAQLKAPAVNRPGQPLEPGVEHFFARARLIKLTFRDAPDEIQQKIIEHFLASLRLWYLACASCPPESAAIISFRDQFWVIGSFIAALEDSDSLAPQKPFQPPTYGARVNSTLNELLRIKRLADTGPGRRERDGMPLSDYNPVDKSSAAVKRLCAEKPGAIDNRLAAAWEALCSVNPVSSQYELAIVKDGGEQ